MIFLKSTGVLLFFMLASGPKDKMTTNSTKAEAMIDSVLITPNPANIYLDFKLKGELFFSNDTTKCQKKISVLITNQKGMMVFSATKNTDQFSIFTGGLPEGNYTLFCNIGKTQVQRDFSVKH